MSDEQDVRMSCLHLARMDNHAATAKSTLEIAESFADWVLGKRVVDLFPVDAAPFSGEAPLNSLEFKHQTPCGILGSFTIVGTTP